MVKFRFRCGLMSGLLLLTRSMAQSPPDPLEDLKQALIEEYYALIHRSPAQARRIRDSYMDLVNAPGAAPPFRSFVLGSQWPGSLDEEQFPSRKGRFPARQAAEIMIAAGSDILKISPTNGTLRAQGIDPGDASTLDEIVAHPFYRRLLDLPYRVMLMWAHGGGRRMLHRNMSPAQREELYSEMYNLTRFLLTTYNNSGKTFLLGNWEGDWMAGGYEMGHRHEMDPERIEGLREWLDVRTSAIDQAKADTPHENVAVYTYLELNSVRAAKELGLQRLVNAVLPYSRVDFVSLSSYDFQNYHRWPRPRTVESLREQSFAIFDFVEQHLPPRDIPGKRVFIGEIGHTVEEIARQEELSVEEARIQQARAALMQAQVSLEWGTPLWLWWATFSSREGTFGLVDNHTNEPAPLLFALREYYQWARAYNIEYHNRFGRLPGPDTFRTAATEQIKRQLEEL